jgi:hypothetical protein
MEGLDVAAVWRNDDTILELPHPTSTHPHPHHPLVMQRVIRSWVGFSQSQARLLVREPDETRGWTVLYRTRSTGTDVQTVHVQYCTT